MSYIIKSTKDRSRYNKDNTPRVHRHIVTYPIIHDYDWFVEVNYDFVILPIGSFYHQNIRKAKRGDIVQFLGGENKTIYDVCFVSIGSSMFRNLCRLRYGREPLHVTNQWKRTAVSQGFAPNAIDDNMAAVVWFKKNDKERLIILKNDRPTP